jgi:hypothetical protein
MATYIPRQDIRKLWRRVLCADNYLPYSVVLLYLKGLIMAQVTPTLGYGRESKKRFHGGLL